MKNYKLCFIKEQWAYFTLNPIIGKDKQWGDDWNDVPYDCNASPPYGDKPGEIIKVAYKSELLTPSEYHYGAPYSAEHINNGVVPWLADYYGDNKDTKIMAGCSLEDFITIVLSHGGEIYTKYTSDTK